jgi:predicted metal-binding membrane protein
VRFLTEHWRPGRFGSLVLGVRHGAYCVGCCWLLMALLFVGGVMNLIWIAMLTLIVLVEKLSPAGEKIGKLSGYLLMVWAVATLLV